jgi:uncharacterized protein YdeI (YjbR/CyaY-like superfamily)
MNYEIFLCKVAKIGINPYVSLPEDVLDSLFQQAEKSKGPIPVRGTINEKEFKQTLVKYQGAWRLYLNGSMRQAAGVDVGDQVRIDIEFDPEPRIEQIHPRLLRALSRNKRAKAAFESLTPARRKEILRYLNSIKTEASIERNVEKVIQYLLGEKPEGMRALTSRKP